MFNCNMSQPAQPAGTGFGFNFDNVRQPAQPAGTGFGFNFDQPDAVVNKDDSAHSCPPPSSEFVQFYWETEDVIRYLKLSLAPQIRDNTSIWTLFEDRTPKVDGEELMTELFKDEAFTDELKAAGAKVPDIQQMQQSVDTISEGNPDADMPHPFGSIWPTEEAFGAFSADEVHTFVSALNGGHGINMCADFFRDPYPKTGKSFLRMKDKADGHPDNRLGYTQLGTLSLPVSTAAQLMLLYIPSRCTLAFRLPLAGISADLHIEYFHKIIDKIKGAVQAQYPPSGVWRMQGSTNGNTFARLDNITVAANGYVTTENICNVDVDVDFENGQDGDFAHGGGQSSSDKSIDKIEGTGHIEVNPDDGTMSLQLSCSGDFSARTFSIDVSSGSWQWEAADPGGKCSARPYLAPLPESVSYPSVAEGAESYEYWLANQPPANQSVRCIRCHGPVGACYYGNTESTGYFLCVRCVKWNCDV
jgi:hypothetical protein